ncbi:MFS transporter [Sphingomonas sp. NSE70-1]|uniref:MFS transporter n=1 Tax=Sphingomonas caseinilyticus TaxID=2908205 RepID=A0ABT0RQG4_9SPHN|nr:MFS transporter [Sphingomonas caseinilyticus]MCL6697257.1 MFS transporter [Sphingomonas caseinilyticus]
MTQPYQFKPHERPIIPGSPFNPDHPSYRMCAYGAIGVLAGITGGLGNALVTANLAFFQGTLGLTAEEAAWIPPAYVMTNVCANLVLVKFRQQFGLALFIRLVLVGYALTALIHLFVHGFWSALLIRAASGIAASGLVTLCILAMFQAMPGPKRLYAILIGISIPQVSTPLARALAPALLEWGDWRMTYFFELGLALLTLAAVLILPLPPSEREKVFEKTDFLTIGLLFPGIGLLCAALGLGRTLWWTEEPWIGWALIGAVILITAGIMIEHRRAKPLLTTRWLSQWVIIRIALVAMFIRILLSEQTFGSVGLLTTLGMGVDQFQTLYIFVTLASLAGLVAAIWAFQPQSPARLIQIACLMIAAGAFLDAGATNLTRPENIYFSQALIGFGALLFVGPAMAIGISRTLLAGPQNFISWIVLFSATQNLGGLIGPALFGTFQTVREKFHSHNLVEQVLLTNPNVASRLSGSAQQVNGVVADPTLRSAEGAILLGRQVTREANILAYNDVFLVIGILACLLFLWGVSIELRMRRRGEISPIVLLAQRMAAMAPARPVEGQKS